MQFESYFSLKNEEQFEIIQYYSNKLSMRDYVLEKDIWLCLILDIIFNIPNKHPMAFKGGTSLSKVFGVIDLFSEDIDITLDYRYFDISSSFSLDMSKTKIKHFSDKLKNEVNSYRDNIIIPELKHKLQEYSIPVDIKVDESGERVWINYPSIIGVLNQYIKESILIELGGRNIIDPNEKHIVKPYILEDELNISLPEAKVIVLSPQRTFWEKATLIHVECHRGVKQNAERLSCHWYDLVKLYDKGIGKQALFNQELLLDVVNLKSIFFNSSYAHYDDCLDCKFVLAPNDNHFLELEKDYNEMCNSGMIYDDKKYDFYSMMERIKEIESEINSFKS
ncbi:nucleotidyl transferase AbiEii/AbiGii toxin family protein [Lonepinella sp. BR2930]|uniref:nucleotidyl transferase AbiEii/AbiGii toxin family protein n=1 Tax=Lonepinella sp. BR2930 TaxID=3434554 RepID=UPI003F6E416B